MSCGKVREVNRVFLALANYLAGVISIGLLAGCAGGSSATPSVAPSSSVAASDDTASLQALIDKGGVIQLEPRMYHLTSTLVIRRSGTVLVGAGDRTVLEYIPSQTPKHCMNDRVITTPCDFDDPLPRQIAAPINTGDTVFSAVNSTDVQDVQVGDWLLINDYDSVIGDRVAVDWVQVQSVTGLQISVAQPFRMAFTNARPWVAGKSGLGFERITAVVENTELRNFSIVVDQGGAGAAGISIFGALNTTIDGISVTDHKAQPLYCYLAKGLTITNSQTQGGGILSEFASSVDVTIEGNHFRSTSGPGFGLDLGLGFFTVSGNTVDQSANAGIDLLYAVHDGTVSGNQIAQVSSTGAGGSGSGMLVWGSQNITISSNYLAGGDGAESIGISVRPFAGELPEPDTGIAVAGNTIAGFATAIQML